MDERLSSKQHVMGKPLLWQSLSPHLVELILCAMTMDRHHFMLWHIMGTLLL
jgi:hypothetical protein